MRPRAARRWGLTLRELDRPSLAAAAGGGFKSASTVVYAVSRLDGTGAWERARARARFRCRARGGPRDPAEHTPSVRLAAAAAGRNLMHEPRPVLIVPGAAREAEHARRAFPLRAVVRSGSRESCRADASE